MIVPLVVRGTLALDGFFCSPEDRLIAESFPWRADGGDYPCTWIGNRVYRFHQLVLRTGPGLLADHRNGDRRDNRRSNLRPATLSLNAANRRRTHGTSQFRRVTLHRATGKYQAGLKFEGRFYYAGLFADEIEAAIAADAMTRSIWGDALTLNFPRDEAPCAWRAA